MKKNDLPKVEPVKLKPLFGLKPGVWLTIVYLSAIILILFVVGIVPDLVDPSKRVSFTSSYSPQAVYIDGNYAGGTPFTTKVKSGTHSVEYYTDKVLTDSFEIKVSNPVFFNWLFPRKMTVTSNAKMPKDAFIALTSAFLNDVATYSAILDYDNVTRYKDVFSTYVKAISEDGTYKQDRLFEKALNTGLLFITTEEMKQDAQNATGKAVETVTPESPVYNIPSIEKVQDGYLINKSFVMARKTVTESEFNSFIKENPKWAKSNIDELVKEGLVDEYYLSDFKGSSIEPVRNISYFAAKAYCKWLSESSGKSYDLPTEEQWTLSCLVADSNYQTTLVSASNSDKPVAMLGGLWELTDTYYIPGDLNSTSEAQTLLKEFNVISDVIVKGGSYINKANEVTAYSCGTSPMNLCSDYMGFRVVHY